MGKKRESGMDRFLTIAPFMAVTGLTGGLIGAELEKATAPASSGMVGFFVGFAVGGTAGRIFMGG